MTKRVAVLKGGWCAEREVSLSSGHGVGRALRREGFDVEEIDVGRTIVRDLQASFGGQGPEVVFNALHGPWGEDGRIQSILELLDLPYTHSGVLASALAMDKPRAKTVLRAAGLPVPGGETIQIATLDGTHPMAPPYVLKPVADGSSFGVHIIHSADDPAPRADDLDHGVFGDVAMVEPFIPGRELTTAVMGKLAFGVTEIVPKGKFYDFESKYDKGGSVHVLPAQIPRNIAERIKEMALEAAEALGCRGLNRTDFRWDEEKGLNGLFILEVNTQPGLTPTSLAPEQAAATGLEFGALCRWMVEEASCPR